MNLIELLESTARCWPEKPAIIEESATVSYSELLEKVTAFTAQLQALGVREHCRVGLCYPNSTNYVALTFALWRLDAVVVPIPTECTAEELAAITDTLQLEAIVRQKQSPAATAFQPDCFFTRTGPMRKPDHHGLNIAFIRFTSGTTSARKGVVLCHETVRARVLAANKAFRIGPEDTVMWCLPMSHHFLITIVLYLSQGATIVISRHVIARSFLESVNRWRGTVLYATPFQYSMLARDQSALGLSSVRLAVSTTCALPQDVAEDFASRFGFSLVQALGVIELGLVSLNLDDPLRRWNSVGRPIDDHQLRIVSPDEEGCGEVAVKGPGIFDAYAAPWLPRDRILHDGWFHTGDIGRLDADGFLYLVGRKTDVINLAGRKVFPEEIESVLNRHPSVRESRVYGRVHAHLGEVVEAEVVLNDPNIDLDSIRELCGHSLASYKVPSRLHIVSQLPRTAATGKIRRAAAVA